MSCSKRINEIDPDEMLSYTYKENGVEHALVSDCPGRELDKMYDDYVHGWHNKSTFLEMVRDEGYMAIAARTTDFELGQTIAL